MNLTNFIWEQFPPHFEDNDTLQDAQGKGIFQRFLSVFGIEMQEELVPKLEGLINEKDPNTASDKFLSELAYSLGRPTDVLQNVDMYRTLLTQIISIYKIKGTKKSYELLFALLGLTATLIEHFPGENLYDTGLIYDDATEDAQLYDKTSCEVGCIDYSIEYSNIDGFGTGELTVDQQQALRLMITDFIEPIDCSLRDLIYSYFDPNTVLVTTITNGIGGAFRLNEQFSIIDGETSSMIFNEDAKGFYYNIRQEGGTDWVSVLLTENFPYGSNITSGGPVISSDIVITKTPMSIIALKDFEINFYSAS